MAEANNQELDYADDALRGQWTLIHHVVLGLLFLKYISDSFETGRDQI